VCRLTLHQRRRDLVALDCSCRSSAIHGVLFGSSVLWPSAGGLSTPGFASDACCQSGRESAWWRRRPSRVSITSFSDFLDPSCITTTPGTVFIGIITGSFATARDAPPAFLRGLAIAPERIHISQRFVPNIAVEVSSSAGRPDVWSAKGASGLVNRPRLLSSIERRSSRGLGLRRRLLREGVAEAGLVDGVRRSRGTPELAGAIFCAERHVVVPERTTWELMRSSPY